jgi:hypothetical protein
MKHGRTCDFGFRISDGGPRTNGIPLRVIYDLFGRVCIEKAPTNDEFGSGHPFKCDPINPNLNPNLKSEISLADAGVKHPSKPAFHHKS